MGLNELLYLSDEDVRCCGGDDFRVARTDVRSALSIHTKGQSVQPPKVSIRPNYRGQSEPNYIAMPAFLGGDYNMAGVKWVNVGKMGACSTRPAITSLILLNDVETALPAAIVEGTLLTGVRTAAVTALATELLANPDAQVLAIVGAGWQGRMHLQALSEVLPNLKEIRVYSRTFSKSKKLTEEFCQQIQCRLIAVSDAENAVRGADVVVSATSAEAPIIQGNWLKEGVFYAQIGTHECTFDAVRSFDKVLVDDWEQVLQRGVQTLAVMARQGEWSSAGLDGTLGQLINGVVPGRESVKEKIMFSGIGLGVVDLAIATRVYREAVRRGIGNRLPFLGKREETVNL